MVVAAGGRTPSGVRGLKYHICFACYPANGSHPVRGAWIEMVDAKARIYISLVAPRQGCVD